MEIINNFIDFCKNIQSFWKWFTLTPLGILFINFINNILVLKITSAMLLIILTIVIYFYIKLQKKNQSLSNDNKRLRSNQNTNIVDKLENAKSSLDKIEILPIDNVEYGKNGELGCYGYDASGIKEKLDDEIRPLYDSEIKNYISNSHRDEFQKIIDNYDSKISNYWNGDEENPEYSYPIETKDEVYEFGSLIRDMIKILDKEIQLYYGTN